jgi:hypothetical protein
VRAANLAHVRIGEVVASCLTAEVLDSRGWPGLIEDHRDADPVAVDALIYALAHALGIHNPTQTVALARDLQPGSAIKRVMRAREQGYLGEAQRGRSGGLSAAVSA